MVFIRTTFNFQFEIIHFEYRKEVVGIIKNKLTRQLSIS